MTLDELILQNSSGIYTKSDLEKAFELGKKEVLTTIKLKSKGIVHGASLVEAVFLKDLEELDV